jgi:5-methylcytosine-specific restriction protein B
MTDLNARPTWFVGASHGANNDQTQRFLREGIWENGYTDKYLDLVRSMAPGDRIAIKSSYTRKHGLPFDNQGNSVSVLALKVLGTITENLGDGRHIRVAWEPVGPQREWYFFTIRSTIWKVEPTSWEAEGLIRFAFEGKAQDIKRFRNAPYWRERFGDTGLDRRFAWTPFFEAIATKLLSFRTDRKPLIDGLKDISSRISVLNYLHGDQFADGTKGFVQDICPFTVMGVFNRHTTHENRKVVAGELAKLLGVTEPVPEVFEGVPILDNRKSWFFPYAKERPTGHIDALWSVFAAAIELADAETEEAQTAFGTAYDAALGRPNVSWNLTQGLYRARPWAFASLDANSQRYISARLGIRIGTMGSLGRPSGSDYVSLVESLNQHFEKADSKVHSFPELSLAAWEDDEAPADAEEVPPGALDAMPGPAPAPAPLLAKPLSPYGIDRMREEGCFLGVDELRQLLTTLLEKKNLILQGPPGTGKTWLARRLAYTLLGQRDDARVRSVQFHPSLSYEDFVRGWRPVGDGRLALADGVFMEMVKSAAADPEHLFVLVIEEINRGNPARIFGELLTLLEASKRSPEEAIELCYPDPSSLQRRVYVPPNLFVIGTMNLADRSLALVDLALRRRFAFVDLEPRLGVDWTAWVVKHGLDATLANDIERRMASLNVRIAKDERLGKQFRIGHSYVTPVKPIEPGSTKTWFRQVVASEVGPLLDEYYFDRPSNAQTEKDLLLKDW